MEDPQGEELVVGEEGELQELALLMQVSLGRFSRGLCGSLGRASGTY